MKQVACRLLFLLFSGHFLYAQAPLKTAEVILQMKQVVESYRNIEEIEMGIVQTVDTACDAYSSPVYTGDTLWITRGGKNATWMAQNAWEQAYDQNWLVSIDHELKRVLVYPIAKLGTPQEPFQGVSFDSLAVAADSFRYYINEDTVTCVFIFSENFFSGINLKYNKSENRIISISEMFDNQYSLSFPSRCTVTRKSTYVYASPTGSFPFRSKLPSAVISVTSDNEVSLKTSYSNYQLQVR